MGFQQNITTLKKYFGADAIARRLKEMQPVKTTILDLIFPTRRQHPSSVLGLDEITENTGIVPVIRRGSRSFPTDADSGGLRFIDPQPITPSLFAKANEINDLFATGMRTSVQAFVDSKIDKLRRICRRTTEVLAAQAISGTIAYKMITEGGSFVDYSVAYGSTLTLDDTDWTNAGLADMIKDMEAIYKELQNHGHSGDIRFLMGDDGYAKLLEKVLAARNIPAQFVDYGLLLGGKYKIAPMGETYTLPGASTASYVVDPKKVCAVDVAAGHALHYCAIDDLEANLQPLPFYAKPVYSDDPSGVKIIGNSKPMPAPVANAILWRRLLPA